MAERVGEVYVDVKARGLQQAQNQIRSFLGQLGPLGAIAGGVFAGQLATTALAQLQAFASGFVNFFKEAVEQASVQEQASLKLAQALKLSGQYTDELYQSLLGVASAIQATTTYGDEQLIPVMAMFARTGRFGADEIERMTRLTADLAAATGINLETAARMVLRAIQGQAAGLTRIGIVLDQNILKSRDQAAIIAAIERQIKGTANVLANTWAGKLQQINNLWGDMQEKIGEALTKSPEMLNFLDRIKVLMTGIVNMAQRFADMGMWDRLGRALSRILNDILQIAVALSRVSVALAPLIAFSPGGMAMIAAMGMTPLEYIRLLRDEADALAALYEEVKRGWGELEDARRKGLMEALGGKRGPYAPIPGGYMAPVEATETATATGVIAENMTEANKAALAFAHALQVARESISSLSEDIMETGHKETLGKITERVKDYEQDIAQIQHVQVNLTREQIDLIDLWAARLSGGLLPRYEAIKAAMYSLQTATISLLEGQQDWGKALAQSLAFIATNLIPGVGQFLAPIAGAATGRLWDWLFGHGLKQEVNFRQEIVINIGEGMISEKAFWDNLVHYYILPGLRRGGLIPQPVGGAG